MAWIRVIEEDEADDEQRDAYARAGAARGRVANILKVHGIAPKTLTAHLALYQQVMLGRSELTRRERETIAVAVSAANRCHY